jgi:hypothetical protein
VHAKFGEGFFFLRLTRISRGKAGKYAWGIILEKSKKNRRRIVEIFGECRPSRRSACGGRIQLNCPAVLRHLSRQLPIDGIGIIGLTMHDLYESEPDLFVAGLAAGNGGVACFSFARYDPAIRFSKEFWHDMSEKKRFSMSIEGRGVRAQFVHTVSANHISLGIFDKSLFGLNSFC